MSLSNKPQSIRFGKSILWNLNHQIPSTNVTKIKTFNPFLQPHVSQFVVNYFIGLIRALFIREWCLPKVSKIKFRRRLWKMPITIGRHSIQVSYKKIIISINLFLDTRNFHKRNLADMFFLVKSAQSTLSNFFNCNVTINYINYFKLYVEAAVSPKPFRKYLKFSTNKRYSIPHTINLDKIREYSFYIQIRRNYSKLKFLLKKFSYNRYFPRIFNVFFSAFQNKKFDPWLIVNAISFEISNLRKRHAPFIKFVFAAVKIFFKKFKRKFNMNGIKLQFKGRMVPFNREHPRSLLKVIRIGCMNSSTVDIKTYQADVKSASRFGSVFISLTVSQSVFKSAPGLINNSIWLSRFSRFNKSRVFNNIADFDLNPSMLKSIYSTQTFYISNIISKKRMFLKSFYFARSSIFNKLLIKNNFFRRIFIRQKIKPKIRYFLVNILYYIISNAKHISYKPYNNGFYFLNNFLVFFRNFTLLSRGIFNTSSHSISFKKQILVNSAPVNILLFKIFQFNLFNEKNQEVYVFFLRILTKVLTKWLSGFFLFNKFCNLKSSMTFTNVIIKKSNATIKLNNSALFSIQSNKFKKLLSRTLSHNLVLFNNLKLTSSSLISGGSYFVHIYETLNYFRQYIQLILQVVFNFYLKDDLTDKYIFSIFNVFLFFHYKKHSDNKFVSRTYRFNRLRFKVESFWSPFGKSDMDEKSNYLSYNVKTKVINNYFSIVNKKNRYLKF